MILLTKQKNNKVFYQNSSFIINVEKSDGGSQLKILDGSGYHYIYVTESPDQIINKIPR